ncbi:hypothetical protein QYE76_013714 [Lolium multiflorum]|uniref:Uncharacterized protein n=1 Tax=Lolium multiflorum TaxID=4521 RepID=A0AAD8U3I0_LOLMU|nr:hypothetical protein QYE76_013714 [Lolium multiflorum]
MRWAVEGNRYTDNMIHPSDGSAWKNFVKKFPLKAGDPRSVAVAISTDGFNPYGPKYSGKNMNVYLEPLVDDFVRGWEGRRIRTYDASKKEYFDMQAVTFFWLNKGGKYSCFDEARQFLERRHEYKSDVKSFKKGRVVHDPKPILKTGTEIKAELDALQPSPDGNGFLFPSERETQKLCQMIGNKRKIEASIADAVLNLEVANFTTKHYDPNIPTKHNPVLRYNATNNEEVPKLSIFIGLGGKSSGSKPYETNLHERTLIHSSVLNTMVEVKPYIK